VGGPCAYVRPTANGAPLTIPEQMFKLLNVNSVSADRADADLTTKARIRDAAIGLFPSCGFTGTTVRRIAADAGVSPGLVIHHFGSKESLRRACDEYVIHRIGATKRRTIQDGSYRQGGTIAFLYQTMEAVTRYLAWALRSGGEASERIFDELLEDVIAQMEEYREVGLMAEVEDVRTQAAVILVMQLGGLVLHEHYSRVLGVDTLSAEGLMTIAPHVLRAYSGELFDPGVIAEAGRALEDYMNMETSRKRDGQ